MRGMGRIWMRFWAVWFAAMALCAVRGLCGGLELVRLDVTSNTTNASAYVAATNETIRGWLEELIVDVPAGVTGTVTVTVSPWLSGVSAVTVLSTNDLVDEIRTRPRWDGTDTAGADLSSDPPWRLPIVGESVIVGLTNCSLTNATVSVALKVDQGGF